MPARPGPSSCLFLAFAAALLVAPDAPCATLRDSRPPTQSGALTEGMAETPGVLVTCTDVRTGTPFEFRAQHVLGSGTVDSTWVPDSSRLCVGSPSGGRQHVVSDGAGGVLVAWVDERRGDPDILLQHLDAEGAVAAGWPATGLAVCEAPRSQYHLDAIADGSGGVYLAWEDYRLGAAGDIAVHHLGASGAPEPGWPEGGLLVCREGATQTSPRLARDGSGGVFVVWQDRRGSEPVLFGLRLLADGSRASGWPEEGAALTSGPGADRGAALLADAGGHAVLVWRHEGTDGLSRLLAARLDAATAPSSGGLSPVVPLTSDAAALTDPVMVAADGSALIAWSEWHPDSAAVRLQRVAFEGTLVPAWSEGGVSVHVGAIGHAAPVVRLLTDGGVLVAWEDRAGGADSDVRVQRVSSSGATAAGWPAEGAPACVAPGDQYGPSLGGDGADGAIVTWMDAQSDARAAFAGAALALRPGMPALLASRATPGRARLVWGTTLKDLGDVPVQRRLPGEDWRPFTTVALDDSNHLVLDDRTAPEGVRVEYRLVVTVGDAEVYLTPVPIDIPRAPTVLLLHWARPSPGRDGIRCAFALPRGTPATLELFDIAGRRLGRRVLGEFEPGEHEVAVPARSRLMSGMYFVRLSQGPVDRVAKVAFTR